MLYRRLIFLVAPCFKNLLRLEAGYPALRCHILEEEPPTSTPQRLEIIPPGLGYNSASFSFIRNHFVSKT